MTTAFTCLGSVNKGKDMNAIKLNISKKKLTKLPGYTDYISSDLEKFSCSFSNSFAFETIVFGKKSIAEKNQKQKPLDDSLLDDASINFLINDYDRGDRRNQAGEDSQYWRNFIEMEGRIDDSYEYDSAQDIISDDDYSYGRL